MRLLSLSSILFASLVSCKGARVTVCVVDAPNSLFQCSDDKKQFSKTLEEGRNLKCSSPAETESFLKACKQGKVLDMTLCTYQHSIEFSCIDPQKNEQMVSLDDVDNYFCVTDQHKKRIIERCLNQ